MLYCLFMCIPLSAVSNDVHMYIVEKWKGNRVYKRIYK